MPREDWRDREIEHERRRAEAARPREDFGQADYSGDYAYDPETRSGYRAEEDLPVRGDDYGQADYSTDWAYDAERGRPYRRFSEDDRDYPERRPEPSRSWMDRAGDFLGGRPRHDPRRLDTPRDEEDRRPRRRGPSDRVLWAVIVERLEDQRRLDLHDVEVIVEGAEVTLNGTVRRKEDKRRIEDVADIEGVRHVQNNLRVRNRDRHWTFL